MATFQINVLLTTSVSLVCDGRLMWRNVVYLSPRCWWSDSGLHMSHFDSCQLSLVWLVRITLTGPGRWKRSFISFSFLCWCDILYQLICRENDWSFIWAREMVMWLLSADVWFWQLPIHPHTDGLQSVNFSKMWHLTSAYMKCVYGWAYATS